MADTAPSEPVSAAATPEARLAEQLGEVLAAEYGDPEVRVHNLRRLTGGASQETWAFDAIFADGSEQPLILRRDPPEAIRPGGAMQREATAIEAAARAGVPVPKLIARSGDTAALDAPFIVTAFVEGETVPRRILRDEAYAAARSQMAERCGEILA